MLQTGSQTYIIPQRNLEHILIASSTFPFRDSVQIKKEFAEPFPLKRLIHAFNTTRGNVHLEFLSEEEANEIFENWKPEFQGSSTKIRRVLPTEKPNCAVITKKFRLDVTDENDSKLPKYSVHRCKSNAFHNKRDSTKLGTDKTVLKSENDHGKALHQGLFIVSIFYKTKQFVQNGIKIVRCFKCQMFGHMSAKCQSADKCGHCSENHLFRECPNKKQEINCAQCNLKHPANFIQ